MSDTGNFLEPVHADEDEEDGQRWSHWLVVFLRVMAALSLIKGLYHWAVVCGIDSPKDIAFDAYATPYQAATVFFAVIDLVAAVGLWLAAPWGAVVWLTSLVSAIVIEVFFPQIFDNLWLVLITHVPAIVAYLVLAVFAAREQPQ